METVLLIPTPDAPTGRSVLRALEELADGRGIELRAGAVVARRVDGGWDLPEETEKFLYRGTITSGALGALIGMLAGPVGLVVGATAGLLVGSSVEIGDAQKVESMIHALPRLIPPGTTAVIADVNEADPVTVDRALLAFALPAWRIPRREVEATVAELATASERGAQAGGRT